MEAKQKPRRGLTETKQPRYEGIKTPKNTQSPPAPQKETSVV